MKRLAFALILAALIPLGAAKCSIGGGGSNLPIKTQIEWLTGHPIEQPIRIGQKPAWGEWEQIGWVRGPRPRTKVWGSKP